MNYRLGVCVAAAVGVSASADVVDVPCSRDNTLYEAPLGNLSNGACAAFFVGKTSAGTIRRGLVRFDLAGLVPAGSVVSEAQVTLTLSNTISLEHDVLLHRSLKDWGEAGSNSGLPGGRGAPAQVGDATWLHTFYDSALWGTPGGSGVGVDPDYVEAASAVTPVGGSLEGYVWGSTAALVADVQAWVDNPGTNFGWFVIGDELTAGSAKRFESRESLTAAARPVLRVTFTRPCYPNCDGSTVAPVLNVNDFICFQQKYAAGDPYANCDGSSIPPILNVNDFICFSTAFAGGCGQ